MFILTLGVMMLAGCSKESLNDNLLNETADLEMNQQNLTASVAAVESPFIIRGYGDMKIVSASFTCQNMVTIKCEGLTKEASFGTFKTLATVCTDRKDTYKLEGKHIFKNGDELRFYSEKFGVDDFGDKWHIYIYDGGTGIFKGATGTLKLYERTDFPSVLQGSYKNEGSGTLVLMK